MCQEPITAVTQGTKFALMVITASEVYFLAECFKRGVCLDSGYHCQCSHYLCSFAPCLNRWGLTSLGGRSRAQAMVVGCPRKFESCVLWFLNHPPTDWCFGQIYAVYGGFFIFLGRVWGYFFDGIQLYVGNMSGDSSSDSSPHHSVLTTRQIIAAHK